MSVRERSTSDLMKAIHSPADEQYILDRTRLVLRLYYEPEMSDRDRAELYEEYRKALRKYPKWAVAKAYDSWVSQHNRRPSPGEIAVLAKKHMEPFVEEIRWRREEEQRRQEWERDKRASTPTPEEAQAIMDMAGFTPERIDAIKRAPMATSFESAEETPERPRHWSETCGPDDPRWEHLNKSRSENMLMPIKDQQEDNQT